MTKSKALRFAQPGPPPPEPPAHLGETMSAWWRELLAVYELGAHHLELLRLACEAWDVAQDARGEIAANGPTVLDRFGQVKPNPAATVWKENVNTFRLLVRELGLDKLPDAPRAPRLY